MSKFVVGYIDWFDHNLKLELIEADTWREAVSSHSSFPWKEEGYTPNMKDPEAFKHECFDADCMMSWLELPSV